MPLLTPPDGPDTRAWMLFGPDLLLRHASLHALRLLHANAGVLHLCHQRLQAGRQRERLMQAFSLAQAQGQSVLALARAGQLPLTLLLQHSGETAAGSGWLVILRDPDAERPDTGRMQQLFGLTPAEAAVAAALAQGRSTAAIAQQLGVQPNTVLAHVKKLLTKTSTQGQVQLVSLLLRSVAMAAPAAAAAAAADVANVLGARPALAPPPDCGAALPKLHEPCPFG